MKRALPAARSVSAASSVSESAVSPAAASASARASSAVSGSSSSTVASGPSGVPDGRRVATTSHGRGAGCGQLASTSCDASSSQCVSSTTSAVGIISSRVSN